MRGYMFRPHIYVIQYNTTESVVLKLIQEKRQFNQLNTKKPQCKQIKTRKTEIQSTPYKKNRNSIDLKQEKHKFNHLMQEKQQFNQLKTRKTAIQST